MKDDTTITPPHQPGLILEPLTEVAREGAGQMLAAALKAKAANFVAQFNDDLLPDGRQRVVHHGTGPERMIQTGIGPLAVKRHKVRDRAEVPVDRKIRFTSNILPHWARRSSSLDALLLVLYLRGVSTGDFQEALTALLGPDAPNLSPGVSATDSKLAGGLRPLAAPRPFVASLCLHPRRRRLPSGPDGTASRVHAGDPRGHTRRKEGTRGIPGRGARKRAKLARTAGRSQVSRPCRAARTGRWRWCPGLLEGHG